MTPVMRQPLQPQRPIFAGIDIGTLTCRLLIAESLDTGRLHELFSDRRILRLGQGVDQDRRLAAGAMDRVIATLQEWRKVIDRYEVIAYTAVATSAVRDAQNSTEFLDRVKHEAGFEVEVITGEEEARRTLLGIRSGLAAGVARYPRVGYRRRKHRVHLGSTGPATNCAVDRHRRRAVERANPPA